MDLSKKGLDMFFKEWQLQSLRVLWESGEGLFSRDVWKRVNELRTQPISRTSIIIFLNDIVESGILSGTDLTGQGGHKTRYEAKMSEQKLKQHLAKLVKAKLNEMI
jgi:predicted transcriptional regulator